MPLVTCPCEEMAPMKQVQRDGVEIDVCTKCRGVWLDRGELEKLLAVVSRQADAPQQVQSPAQQPQQPQAAYPPQTHGQGYGERGEAGEHGEYGERGSYGGHKKKRFDIFDIFD